MMKRKLQQFATMKSEGGKEIVPGFLQAFLMKHLGEPVSPNLRFMSFDIEPLQAHNLVQTLLRFRPTEFIKYIEMYL